MKRPEKIDSMEWPDGKDYYTWDGEPYREPNLSTENLEFLLEKHNEIVDIINELMENSNEED